MPVAIRPIFHITMIFNRQFWQQQPEDKTMIDLTIILNEIKNDPEIKMMREASQLLDELNAFQHHWFRFDDIEEKLELAGNGWLNQESVEKGWNVHYEKELVLNEDWLKIENPITRKSDIFISKQGALILAMRSDGKPSKAIRDKLAYKCAEKYETLPIQAFLVDFLGFEVDDYDDYDNDD